MSTTKVVADEVASHDNPKGPPLNAAAMMAAVLTLRRKAALLQACCMHVVSNSVEWVMVLGDVKG